MDLVLWLDAFVISGIRKRSSSFTDVDTVNFMVLWIRQIIPSSTFQGGGAAEMLDRRTWLVCRVWEDRLLRASLLCLLSILSSV